MSSPHTLINSEHDRKILFTNEQRDDGGVSAKARRYEMAFRNALYRMGFESSFPMEPVTGHGFSSIALNVLDCEHPLGSRPRLLIPIDLRSSPDERAIEATLARSVGLMLADEEMFDQIWVDTYSDLQSRFANRPEASLERVDFVAGPHGGLLLHAEFLRIVSDLSTLRCRRIASDIEELIHAVDFDLRVHDRNFAAATVDGVKRYRRRITGLAFRVLEMSGIDPDDPTLRFDVEGEHPFMSVDRSLPFSAGRFFWSKGILECSLEMRKGQCWMDGRRVILSHPSDLPATTLASFIGRALDTFLRVEGLDFEATIRKAHASRGCIVLEIEMPTFEFVSPSDWKENGIF